MSWWTQHDIRAGDEIFDSYGQGNSWFEERGLSISSHHKDLVPEGAKDSPGMHYPPGVAIFPLRCDNLE